MYQKAPASMAATARSSLPLPVMMMAGTECKLVAKALEERQAVYAGKLDVGNQNGWMIVGETSQGVFRAGNAQDIQAPSLEQSLVAAPGILFIFNDKHAIG